ncbi:TetR/AcrR family transcriptional regulator [Amycolatopsis cihanbeyliensis]|uniref:TetR/AcrR family transcriptional regulator n=1 Tax=Amycolatopsis cihanbeyliensis TaxID=1128664 RepID=UPI0011545A8C|nr:TetR family transcriptional regulator [Amycolatopsis cihanbeyliensis]
MTRFAVRARASLREELLEAAADLLPDKGYAGLRMADVATRVGVSRQTVYNEFGNKAELAQAVVLRTTSTFLDGVNQRLTEAEDLLTGVHHAVTFTIEHAQADRLVAAALGTGTAADLLPLLTTRGEPVLRAAMDLVRTHYRSRLPDLEEATTELLAETAVRLTLSHLVLPTHPAAGTADAVCAVLGPALRHAGQQPPGEPSQ